LRFAVADVALIAIGQLDLERCLERADAVEETVDPAKVAGCRHAPSPPSLPQ